MEFVCAIGGSLNERHRRVTASEERVRKGNGTADGDALNASPYY
jgi:hypothetical protein